MTSFTDDKPKVSFCKLTLRSLKETSAKEGQTSFCLHAHRELDLFVSLLNNNTNELHTKYKQAHAGTSTDSIHANTRYLRQSLELACSSFNHSWLGNYTKYHLDTRPIINDQRKTTSVDFANALSVRNQKKIDMINTNQFSSLLEYDSKITSIHRVRRANEGEPMYKHDGCSLVFIRNGLCVPASGDEFSISVGAIDTPMIGDAEKVNDLRINSRKLDLSGFKYHQMLQWLLKIRHWPNITHIFINAIVYIDVDLEWLNGFPDLESISFRTIRHINDSGFVFAKNITSLELSNTYQDTSFHGNALMNMISLKRLHWRHSSMTQLDRSHLKAAPTLESLFITHTSIQHIAQNAFYDLVNLTELEISDGYIAHLPEQLFLHQKNLQRLLINKQRITQLLPMHFTGLSNLRTLNLERNQISLIDSATFRPLIRLEDLILESNRIINLNKSLTTGLLNSSSEDEPVLDLRRSIRLINMRSNPGIQIPDDLFEYLYNMEAIFLAHSRLAKLPKLIHLSNLIFLEINNHIIAELELSTSIPFQNLELLGINKLGKPPMRITWGTNNSNSCLTKMWRFEAINGDITDLMPVFSEKISNTLLILRLGWPGMNEETVPIHTLCPMLALFVENLVITQSGYRAIRLCVQSEFHRLIFADNPLLINLMVAASVIQLNVSNSPNLEILSIPRVAVLDVSQTSLSVSVSFCSNWGYDTLIARNIPAPSEEVLELLPDIFSKCIQNVNVADMSENMWLNMPKGMLIEGVEMVALSEEPVFHVISGNFIPFRRAPPLLQVELSPISCALQFTTRYSIQQDMVLPIRFMYYECGCNSGFHLSGERCMATKVNITGNIIAAVLGTLTVVGAFAFLVWKVMRFRGQRQLLQDEKVLRERLLEEREEEVIALKRVWEIDLSELHFEQRLAAGGFGIVYRAMWEETEVAVKVLQPSIGYFDDSTVHEFEKEVEFLQRTRHPCIVRFFGAGTDNQGKRFLVLEYVALGSLDHLLRGDMEAHLSTYLRTKEELQSSHKSGSNILNAENEECDFMFQLKKEDKVNKLSISSVWQLKLSFLVDIADGMSFIHSLGHIHR